MSDAYYPAPEGHKAGAVLGPTPAGMFIPGTPDPRNPDDLDRLITIAAQVPCWLGQHAQTHLDRLAQMANSQAMRDPEAVDVFTVLLVSSGAVGMLNQDAPGFIDSGEQVAAGTITATRRPEGGRFEQEEYVRVMEARRIAMVYACAQIARRFKTDMDAAGISADDQPEAGKRFLAALVAAVRSQLDTSTLFPSLLELRLDGLGYDEIAGEG